MGTSSVGACLSSYRDLSLQDSTVTPREHDLLVKELQELQAATQELQVEKQALQAKKLGATECTITKKFFGVRDLGNLERWEGRDRRSLLQIVPIVGLL